MKKIVIAAVMVTVLGMGTQAVHATGFPVVDIANLAQVIQQITHMVEQINYLKTQTEIGQEQMRSVSGVRGMGGIIGSIYDNNMDVDFDEILEKEGIQPGNESGLSEDVADLYDAQNQAAAQWEGRSQKYLNQAVTRFDELKKLIAQVNASPDPKDIEDLQARIQGEETLLQNELAKLQMMQSQAQAQQSLNEQKEIQMRLNMFRGTTTDF